MGNFSILFNGENGEAYNIADESSNITIKELAEMIAEIGDQKVVIELPSDIEKAGFNIVKKSVFSTWKINQLGWQIKNTMREKIYNTISMCSQLKYNIDK